MIRLRWGELCLWHCTNASLLLDFVLRNAFQTRERAFADDLTVTGKLADIKNF